MGDPWDDPTWDPEDDSLEDEFAFGFSIIDLEDEPEEF